MGNANSTKAHIETAQKTGTLSLSGAGLSKFPESVNKLQGNLRTLDVSYNKLSKPDSFPPSLGSFQMLKTLIMAHCDISSIPNGIYQLKKLETLNLSFNKIQLLSDSVNQLKNLKSLNLSSNNLEALPSTLPQCKSLEVLDVSENKIQGLPETFGALNVIEFNGNRNRLADLPEEMCKCPRLKSLRLEENCLNLTENLKLVLDQSQVSLICLEGNVFTVKQLESLDEFKKYMERFTATKKKMY